MFLYWLIKLENYKTKVVNYLLIIINIQLLEKLGQGDAVVAAEAFDGSECDVVVAGFQQVDIRFYFSSGFLNPIGRGCLRASGTLIDRAAIAS